VITKHESVMATAVNRNRNGALGYYALMSSLAVPTGAVGLLAGGPPHVTDMLRVVVLGLGLCNLAGAWILFKPLHRATGTGEWGAKAAARLRSLAALSGIWTFVAVIAVMGGHHFLSHPVLDPGQQSSVALLYPLVLIGVYATLMGLVLYFAVGAFVTRARRRLSWLADCKRPASVHLRHRVIVAIIATSVLPLALVAAHRDLAAQMPSWHVMQTQTLLIFDLSASLLLVAAAIVFMTECLTRPVALLLLAMERLQRGHLDARAQVVTDDEIGALARGFNEMVEKLGEQAFLRETLGRFVPEAVAAAVLADRGIVRPRVEEATILFTDIEGFTAVCEDLPPSTVVAMLNEYFGALSEPVRRHNGVITQFQGDAMLVSFNLPVADDDHALSAVRVALDIQRLLRTRRFASGIELRTRIGVSTGIVVGGTVGDDAHLGYTVHGDAVNLAQRLEQANKSTGTLILISARTATLIGDRVALRPLGPLSILGRRAAESAYTPEPD